MNDIEEFDDSVVIKVMIDGGCKLCDYAIEQWNSGKYNLPELRPAYVKRWSLIKDRIRVLGRSFKVESETIERRDQ